MARPHSADELVFVPLGGAGEIGMNLNLYGFGPEDDRKWIMIDCGVTFGGQETPGVDLICPDPAFIEARKADLLGLVVTHGHEDHIGAVALLWPRFKCPVYATPFTASLVKGKLKDAGLINQVPLHIIPLGGELKLGPFAMELVTLTHSIPEPNAIVIRTPLGTIFHTGDWKLDPEPLVGEEFDHEKLRALGDERPLAIVCDSTNVFNPGQAGSESDVRKALTDLIGTLKNRIAVTSFASNVARLESVCHAAEIHGRRVALVGRSMKKIVQAAQENGYLTDVAPFVSEEEAGLLPRSKVLLLCTGSQGEGRAAMSRIAQGQFNNVKLEPGDTVVFSSRMIPGNEKSISDLQNLLAMKGIDVITPKNDDIHVSGHPCRDDLTEMYGWVRPQISVPVHGELRHMIEHARLARELQVPNAIVAPNGSMVRLAPGEPGIIDEVPSGRLHLDGDVLVNAENGPADARRRFADGGFVGLTLVLDEDGDLLADPITIIPGAPSTGKEMSIEDAISEAVDAECGSLGRGARRDDAQVIEAAKRAVRRAARKTWGKKPFVDVRVVRLEDEFVD